MADVLLLLSQYNSESPLPSLFTLYASQYVTKMLWDVFHVGHTSLCTRFPLLMGTMGYSRELHLLVMLALERSCLGTSDSSFSESFFGLKRAGLRLHSNPAAGGPVGGPHVASTAAFGSDLTFAPLTSRQRNMSLAEVALLPYALAKLEEQFAYYTSDQPDVILERRSAARRLKAMRGLWGKLIVAVYKVYVQVLVRTFPLLHTLWKGTTIAFMTLYALEKSVYASPLQRIGAYTARRVTMADQQEAGGAKGSGASKAVALAGLGLSGIFLLLRYSEWSSRGSGAGSSGGSGIGASGEAAVGKVKPPPTAPESAAQAEGNCCVCNQRLVNPAVIISSGVVGCYVCLQDHVERHGTCPVTGQRVVKVHIRRLYEG